MSSLIQKLTRKESVVASASFVLFLTIIEKVTAIVRGVVFARVLGPAEYGVFTLAFFIVPLIVPLARLGIPSCYERYISQYEKKGELVDFLKKNYRITMLSASVMAFLVFMLSQPVSKLLYDSTQYVNIIMLCAMSIIPIVLYENVLASFNGLRIFKMSSLLRFNQILLFTLIGIAVVVLHPNAMSVVSANLVSYIIVSALFGLIIWKYISSSNSQNIKVQENKFYKKMFKYSVWFIITPLFSTLFSYTDRLVLNHFLGLNEVGVYSVAINMSQLVFMFGIITGNVLMPNLSSMWEEGENERVMFIINIAIKFTVIMILSYSVLFVIFKEEIISILYGVKYSEAISVIPILLIFWLNSTIVWLIGLYPNLIEKPFIPFFASVPGFVLNVFLNYMWIPLYGIKGAAFATLCAQEFVLIVLFCLYKREGLKINMNTVVVCFAPFILLLNNIIIVSAFVLIISVTFAGNLIMAKEEKNMLTRQLNKVFNKLAYIRNNS